MAGGTDLALQIGYRTSLDLKKQYNIKKMAKMKIPKKIQWLFWSYKIDSLDLKMQIKNLEEGLVQKGFEFLDNNF